MPRRALLAGLAATLVIVTAWAVIGAVGGPDHAGAAPVVRAASQKPFSARLSYDETGHGHANGAATVGIVGHGAFSAQLSARGAIGAALVALATGVPISKIAEGGTYVVQRRIAGNGDVSGLAVAKFKASGLGSSCLTYTEKPGKFVPGMSFTPMTGAIKTLGGTGAAATWHLNVSFKQNSVSGSSVESFGAGGSEQASTGKAKAMTAACKKITRLR